MAGRLPSESVVAFASESLAAFHRKTQPAARRVQAVTLRVYAYVYSLARRTMRSHLARRRLRLAESRRRPCGSTPTPTLSCAARCARTSPPAPAARRVQAATLRVYAYVLSLPRYS